ALSATAMEALRAPAAAGRKVTVMVQLDPAARLDPQLLVWAKSPGFAPVMVMLEIERAAVPMLLNVTFCGALSDPTVTVPKLTLPVDRETRGAAGLFTETETGAETLEPNAASPEYRAVTV